MIIDCHTHLDDVTQTGKSAEQRLKNLLTDMRRNKIDHSFILADVPEHPKEHMLSHTAMLDLIEGHKNLHLVGKVPLPVAGNKKYLKQLREHVEMKKIIGIKLYPGYEPFFPYDKRYLKVYALCENYEIPLMLHSGDVMGKGHLKYARPIHVDDLATRYPGMKIVICHMGNPWQLDTAAVTFKNENVYTDTSGLFYKRIDHLMLKFLERKIEEFIHWNGKGEKLLFGTDWPITHVADMIKLVKSLDVSAKDKRLIFSGNAKKLFKIG